MVCFYLKLSCGTAQCLHCAGGDVVLAYSVYFPPWQNPTTFSLKIAPFATQASPANRFALCRNQAVVTHTLRSHCRFSSLSYQNVNKINNKSVSYYCRQQQLTLFKLLLTAWSHRTVTDQALSRFVVTIQSYSITRAGSNFTTTKQMLVSYTHVF